MAYFSLVTLQPPSYGHVSAFLDIQLLLYYSLQDLGHDVALATNRFPEGRTAIVFGAHLISDDFPVLLPQGTVIFNTEQLDPEDSRWSERILALAQSHPVWDYSSFNMALLRSLVPGARAWRLRLGCHPQQRRIERHPFPGADFIFYGSITPLRREILGRFILSERLQVKAFFGVYGWTRDRLLRRCLAAINLHSTPRRILEWPRIVTLLANAIPCIALVHPLSRCDDDQLSYLLTADEQDPNAELEALFASADRLQSHALAMQSRFAESEPQAAFTASTLDATWASPFAPASLPPPGRAWTQPAASARPDLQWYVHQYCWVADPRPPEDFHLEEGCFRQYHPDPSFQRQFRSPLQLHHTGSEGRPGGQPLRVAVVLHFHSSYTARLFFSGYGVLLAGIADFWVSCTDQTVAETVISLGLEYAVSSLQIRVIANRGRDIPSKYILFNDSLAGYDLCLFSHGKESNDFWFADHNEILAGSAQRITAILELFRHQPDLGLLFPDYLPGMAPLICWHDMRPLIDALLTPHGWDTRDVRLLEFPAGGFFWARPAALASITDLALDVESLPPEPLARNNTLLHALERLPCLSCERAGLRWEKISRHPGPVQEPGSGVRGTAASTDRSSLARSGLDEPVGRAGSLTAPPPGGDDPGLPVVVGGRSRPVAVSEPSEHLLVLLQQQADPFVLVHLHLREASGVLPLAWQELLAACGDANLWVLVSSSVHPDAASLAFLNHHVPLVWHRAWPSSPLQPFRETALVASRLLQTGSPLQALLLLDDSLLPWRAGDACLANLLQLIHHAAGDAPALAGFSECHQDTHHLQAPALVANRALLADLAWLLYWGAALDPSTATAGSSATAQCLSRSLHSARVELRALYPTLPLLHAAAGAPGLPNTLQGASLQTLNPLLQLDPQLRHAGCCFIAKALLLGQTSGLQALQDISAEADPQLLQRLALDLASLCSAPLPPEG